MLTRHLLHICVTAGICIFQDQGTCLSCQGKPQPHPPTPSALAKPSSIWKSQSWKVADGRFCGMWFLTGELSLYASPRRVQTCRSARTFLRPPGSMGSHILPWAPAQQWAAMGDEEAFLSGHCRCSPHTHTHPCTQDNTCTLEHTHENLHTHIHIHAYPCTYENTYTHTYTSTHTPTRTHTQEHPHTQENTHAHAHTLLPNALSFGN